MRMVRNDPFISRRVKITQRGSLIGMGLLLASLLLSNRNTALSWLFLTVGFVVAMVAVRIGNRYVRPPRSDTVLDKVLKGLDSRYVIFHYYYPVEHLLLTPSGLIAIHTKEQRGRINVRGRRWQHRPFWQRLRGLLGQQSLGNPAHDLQYTLAQTVKRLQRLGDDVASLPFRGLIVFYADKVQLQVEDPEFPTLLTEELKAKVREIAEAGPALPSRVHKAVAAKLAGQAPIEEDPEETEGPPAVSPGPAPTGRSPRSRRAGRAKRGRGDVS